MGRIRTVKPDLFTHSDLFDAEKETGLPLRLAFIGLFTCCDREGRFKWKPRELKIAVLPYDDVDFSRVLHALHTRGFLVRYACQGREFGAIPTFSDHQVINNRESASKLPDPMVSEVLEPAATPENTGDAPRVDDACPTRAPRDEHAASGEGKGREGKGKEGKARESRVSTSPKSTEVREVFDFWISTLGKRKTTVLSPKRKGAVEKRLRDGYTVDDLKQAILGCSRTPHNMGDNDRGERYDDLELICRDPEHVDRFMRNANRVSPQEQQQQDLQAWLNEDNAHQHGSTIDGEVEHEPY